MDVRGAVTLGAALGAALWAAAGHWDGARAQVYGQETPTEAAVVDEKAESRKILNGYRRYNSSCNHCHGPDGVGSSFGPELISAPLPLDGFREIVLNGSASGPNVMKGFAEDPNIAPYIEDIHAYLRARADGSVGRGRPKVKP